MSRVVVGVDGCRGGWIAAAADGRIVREMRRFRDLAAVLLWSDGAAAVVADIPIGLPDVERRDCDVEARRLLRPASSRVFLTPARPLLERWSLTAGRSFRERYADLRTHTVPGRGVSAQTAGLLDKIAEADALVRAGAPLVEGHPELSFRAMTGAVLPGKRTAAGMRRRLDALTSAWPGLDPRTVEDDDHADATALAWTARRVVDGTAECVPSGEVPRDRCGIEMQIVY